MSMQENKMKKLIFISHREKDKDIADFLRTTLESWGVNKNSIFQSTAPGLGPEVGRELNEALKEALLKTNLLFLIYTDSSADWGFCLWECGFADAPTSVETKFVVIECGGQSHPVFKNLLKVQLTKESIRNFIKQFHVAENFIPGFSRLREEISDELLDTWTNNLFEGLKKHTPEVTPDIIQVWDCMVLKLKWDTVNKLIQLSKSDDITKIEKAKDIILDNCLFEYSRGTAMRHFGLLTGQGDKPWQDVLSNWKAQSQQNPPKNWIDNLHIQIYRSVLGQTPEIVEGEFISLARQEIKNYQLILTRVRKWFTGDIDLDIFFYPITTPEKSEG